MRDENIKRLLKIAESKKDPFGSDSKFIKKTRPCDLMTSQQTEKEAAKYDWFHTIQLENGVKTQGSANNREFTLKQFEILDFEHKDVLDAGCRDCFYSLEAEKRGAKKIVSLDVKIPKAVTEFLLPYFDSKIETIEVNFYDFEVKEGEEFDIVIFMGILYHLKYPFWGMNKLSSVVKNGGHVIIESAMLIDDNKNPLVYAPTNGPYGKGSTTFFNHVGLIETMESFGFELLNVYPDRRKGGPREIMRDSFLFRKNEDLIDLQHNDYLPRNN